MTARAKRDAGASMRVTVDQVAELAGALPNVDVTTKWNHRTWVVNGRGFCWVRPLGKADLARLGDARVPVGDVIAVAVESLDAKDALLAMELPGFFTIEHFNGYAAVLIELGLARPKDVRAAIESAWQATSVRPPVKARSKPRKPRAKAR